MEIKTNNQPRAILYGYELPEKAKEDFDYYSADELDTVSFFKFKGQFYDLGDFMATRNLDAFDGWHGYRSDSFFSGVVIKLLDDGESVIVGTYYS